MICSYLLPRQALATHVEKHNKTLRLIDSPALYQCLDCTSDRFRRTEKKSEATSSSSKNSSSGGGGGRRKRRASAADSESLPQPPLKRQQLSAAVVKGDSRLDVNQDLTPQVCS